MGTKKKGLIIAAVIAGALVIAGGSYALFFNDNSSDTPPVSEVGKTSFEPATPVERQEAEDNKDRIVEEQNNAQNNSQNGSTSSKKVVKPTITNTSGNINAYVSGIFEEGGTCTATFVKGSTTKTKTSSGFENVSYTQCAPMDLESGYLSSGSWTVTVKYSSDKAEGTSDPQKVEVN